MDSEFSGGTRALLIFAFLLAMGTPALADRMKLDLGAPLLMENDSKLVPADREYLGNETVRWWERFRGSEKAFTTLPAPLERSGFQIMEGTVLVEVLGKTSFTLPQVVQVTGDPMPRTIKREFQAARVKVLSGNLSGTEGWLIISYSDPTDKPRVFARAVADDYQVRENERAQNRASKIAGVDLYMYPPGAPATSPSGGADFPCSVLNRGSQPSRGSFEVRFECDGKLIYSERVVHPIPAGSQYDFRIHMTDRAIAPKAMVTIRIDPTNNVAESDETNNVLNWSPTQGYTSY